MSKGIQRRLAAIVAADVVGYSRLMGADETGTLAAMRAHRTAVINPLVSDHGGRIVKTMGDGYLMEFPSAVAATQFAIAIQETTLLHGRDLPEDKAIRFRIGVHVGDIIIEDNDIFGDGVNLAARIESLAEHGGVALSDDAYRQVRDKLDIVWDDGGEHKVKNIARPVHIWQWRRNGTPLQPPRDPLVLPDRPSIAVLPFDNMSGDPDQEFFADGMTEDLITDLSKISGLFVVARNSTFVFKGRAVDMREVAKMLGVRYVLKGSVRKVGQRVRINAQLIDAVTGGHLWAERYDGAVDDVFKLQDDVSGNVISALSVRLKGDERARLQSIHTHNLDAYEVYVRAKATPYPPIPERIEAARKLFSNVMNMDPNFAGGYAGVSWMLGLGAMFGHSDLSETATKAEELARKAVELDENFGWSYVALSMALLLQMRHDEAIVSIEDAVARQPNDADAHAYRGLILGFAGRPEDGVAPIELALRLNPQFVNGPYLNFLGIVKALGRDYEGARNAFVENVNRHGPVGPPALAWAAAANYALGKLDETGKPLAQLAAEFGAFRLSGWNFLKLVRMPEDRHRGHTLMCKAGVPE